MMEMAERITEHSQLGVKMSTHMMEMIRYIDILNSKIFELEHRLKEMEKK
jgi:ubiquinone biosynthesis protein UbiJ